MNFLVSKNIKGLTGALIRPTSRNPLQNINKNIKRSSEIYSYDSYKIDLDDLNNGIKYKYLKNYLKNITEEQFTTGHLPYTYKLNSLLESEDIKIIYIYRNPADVWISLYNYHTKAFKPYSKFLKRLEISEGLDCVYNGMQRKGARLSPLSTRIKNSIGWIKAKNVLALKFEELIGRKGGGSDSIQKMKISQIIEHLNLDKHNIDENYVCQNIYDKSSQTFNKGTVGTYKKILSVEQLNKLKNEIHHEIDIMKYDI